MRSWLGAMALSLSMGMGMGWPVQSVAQQEEYEVVAHIQAPHDTGRAKRGGAAPSAVLWLKPVGAGPALPPMPRQPGGYTLLQKNKMFLPHLMVVPAGSVVMFPNADPFFHNVFSLFDGQRFDLGLYEAGKTKAVTFSREGVSYIFCNIHSEMSAVVIALATPLYSIAERSGEFHIGRVPAGEYEMHVWVEGERQSVLDRWVRRVRISAANRDLGAIVPGASPAGSSHENKFGQPYDREPGPPY